jgi:hypothetical protein
LEQHLALLNLTVAFNASDACLDMMDLVGEVDELFDLIDAIPRRLLACGGPFG